MKLLTLLLIPALSLTTLVAALGADDESKSRAAMKAAALENASVDLVRTLRAIEKKYGAIAVELEVENRNGVFIYEMELIDPTTEREIELDLDVVDGRILAEKISILATVKSEGGTKQRASETIMQRGFGLADAIALSQKEQNGAKAIVYQAEVEIRRDIVLAKVSFYTAIGKQKVIIDVEKQSIIPILRLP